MTAEKHYGKLLQLLTMPPLEVTKVEVSLLEQRVTVWILWPNGVRARCPKCGEEGPVYDLLAERRWRHLGVMQYRMELRCATPRCRCEKHVVKTVRVPWAEPGSRFTLHFEAFAVAVIGACRSLTQAAGLLGLHWDSLQRIVIDAAVKHGLARRTGEGITREWAWVSRVSCGAKATCL